MSRSILRAAVAAALVLFAAACDDAPPLTAALPAVESAPTLAAAAEREVYETVYDLEGTVLNADCGPVVFEPIELRGGIFERTVSMWDGSGGYHYTISTMPVDLHGVGLETGTVYRYSERESGQYNATVMSTSGRWTRTVVLAAPMGGPKIAFTYGGQWVRSANGVTVVERNIERVECAS